MTAVRRSFAFLFFTSLLLPSPALAEILIGVAGPMTGQNGPFGLQMKAGAEAAIAAINDAGGVNGENLALQVADDGCDAKTAAAVAQDFAARDVRMVVGHFCTGASLAAAAIYEPRGIIMISPSASLPRLTEAKLKNTFRLASRDDAQADAAAIRINADAPDAKVAVVYEQGALTKTLVERFKAAMPSAADVSFKPGEVDADAVAQSLKEQDIGAVYFVCSGGDAGKIALALKSEQVDVKLYGADPLLAETYWQSAGASAEGTLVSFALDFSALNSARSVVDQLTNNKLPSEGAAIASYAAVQIFAAAAKAQSINDPALLAAYLHSGAEFDTVIGKVSFDTKGDVTPQRFQWYRWSDGSYTAEPEGN